MIDAAWLLSLPEGTRRRRELQPLLHAACEREGRLGELDAKERAFARRAYYATLARSVALRETLEAVLDDAAAEGAQALPLKGALLAFAVYPDAGMRPMSDVDVALRAGEAERVGARLARRGYAQHGAGRRRFDLRHHHHLLFEKPGAPSIDLHLRLVHELGADGSLDEVHARAIPVTLAPRPGVPAPRAVLAPSWDDHLLYVALHAASHGYAESPLWLADLALLVPRAAHPASMGAAAARRRAVAAIHFASVLARRYFPSLPLPVAPAPTGRALRGATLAALLGPDPLAAVPDRITSLLLRLALIDRPSDALRAVAAKVRLRLAERFLEDAR